MEKPSDSFEFKMDFYMLAKLIAHGLKASLGF